jgi:hypothetical protein
MTSRLHKCDESTIAGRFAKAEWAEISPIGALERGQIAPTISQKCAAAGK